MHEEKDFINIMIELTCNKLRFVDIVTKMFLICVLPECKTNVYLNTTLYVNNV